MKSIDWCTAIFSLVIASAAPAAVHVDLSVDPPRTLPGLSVYLRAHVVNDGPQITLAPVARVRVTPENGESFLAIWDGRRNAGRLDVVDDQELTLRVGAGVD